MSLYPIHDRGVRQLAEDEGLRLRPYHCSVGDLSIGIGHSLDSQWLEPHEIENLGLSKYATRDEVIERLNQGVTKDWVKSVFKDDLLHAYRDALNWLPNFSELNEVRQSVVVSMAFQLGPSRLAAFVKTKAALQAGNWQDASQELQDSLVAREQAVTRWQRHAYQMASGEWC